MADLMVFKSIGDALRAGFHVYDRTSDGYLPEATIEVEQVTLADGSVWNHA